MAAPVVDDCRRGSAPLLQRRQRRPFGRSGPAYTGGIAEHGLFEQDLPDRFARTLLHLFIGSLAGAGCEIRNGRPEDRHTHPLQRRPRGSGDGALRTDPERGDGCSGQTDLFL